MEPTSIKKEIDTPPLSPIIQTDNSQNDKNLNWINSNSIKTPLTLIRTRSTPMMVITLYLKEGVTRSIHDLEAASTLKGVIFFITFLYLELKERVQSLLETKIENIELSYNNVIFSNMEDNTILYDIFKTAEPAKINVKLLN